VIAIRSTLGNSVIVHNSVIWLSIEVSCAPGSLPVAESVGHFAVSDSVIWLSVDRVSRYVPGTWVGLAVRRLAALEDAGRLGSGQVGLAAKLLPVAAIVKSADNRQAGLT
jgi:hypothetical protein